MKSENCLVVVLVSLVIVAHVQAQALTTARDYTNRGVARQIKGDVDGAIADYTKAIEIDPRLAPAYNNRGNARRDIGDVNGAIADCSKAIEIGSRVPD